MQFAEYRSAREMIDAYKARMQRMRKIVRPPIILREKLAHHIKPLPAPTPTPPPSPPTTPAASATPPSTPPSSPPPTPTPSRFLPIPLDRACVRDAILVKHPNLSAHDLLTFVAHASRIKETVLLAHAKFYSITPARHLFCLLAREITGRSLNQIGKVLGGRDHTTILHAVRLAERKLHEGDPEFRTLYATIIAHILRSA